MYYVYYVSLYKLVLTFHLITYFNLLSIGGDNSLTIPYTLRAIIVFHSTSYNSDEGFNFFNKLFESGWGNPYSIELGRSQMYFMKK